MTQHFKLEKSGNVDAHASGYSSQSGPGAGVTCSCSAGSGAGHGGVGGRTSGGYIIA